MRPVIAGMCSYENLKNGVLDLEDLLRMNDALDVKEENELRHREASNER
jgi:hypothetical protein